MPAAPTSVPRLPKLPTGATAPAAIAADDVAAAGEVGDASLATEPLPPTPRPGAAFLTARPAKKKIAFVTGRPIAAAVVREVEELKRAREEAVELAAALHGSQPSAPAGARRRAEAPSVMATRGPSPRRKAVAEAASEAAKAASSQQATASRHFGLDAERRPAALDPA